jgi:hypothetical protein
VVQESVLLGVARASGVAIERRSERMTLHTRLGVRQRLKELAGEHEWTLSQVGPVILLLGLAALDAGGVQQEGVR